MGRLRSSLRRAAGFTLIELLVVILIIAILIAVSAPSFLGQTKKAHDSAAKQYLAVAYHVAAAWAVDHQGAGSPWDGNCAADPQGYFADSPAGSGTCTADSLAHAITASEPELSAVAGTCPTDATTDQRHIVVDASGTTGRSLELCNDPDFNSVRTVWVLTVNGPPDPGNSAVTYTACAPDDTGCPADGGDSGSGSVTEPTFTSSPVMDPLVPGQPMTISYSINGGPTQHTNTTDTQSGSSGYELDVYWYSCPDSTGTGCVQDGNGPPFVAADCSTWYAMSWTLYDANDAQVGSSQPSTPVQADCGTIVFSYEADGDSFENNIWTMKSDGSGITRLTSGGGYSQPSFSADGSQIVYEQGSNQIWTMNADGNDQQFVTSGTDPRFTADGKIVYTDTTTGDFNNSGAVTYRSLFTINPDGSGKAELSGVGSLPLTGYLATGEMGPVHLSNPSSGPDGVLFTSQSGDYNWSCTNGPDGGPGQAIPPSAGVSAWQSPPDSNYPNTEINGTAFPCNGVDNSVVPGFSFNYGTDPGRYWVTWLRAPNGTMTQINNGYSTSGPFDVNSYFEFSPVEAPGGSQFAMDESGQLWLEGIGDHNGGSAIASGIGGGSFYPIRWSSDGSQLLFSEGTTDLHVIGSDGSGDTTLGTFPGLEGYDWTGPVVIEPRPGGTPPSISDNNSNNPPQSGDTLVADNGTWTNNPTSFTYQWLSCDSSGSTCSDIGSATGSTYDLTDSDIGNRIRVLVTASNSGGSATLVTDPTLAVVAAPGGGGGGGGGCPPDCGGA